MVMQRRGGGGGGETKLNLLLSDEIFKTNYVKC